MPLIKIEGLKPGMVLAAGIKNHSNRKLLPEGTQLTEKHILNLKAWGVTEANVQNEGIEYANAQFSENIDPKKLAAVEREAEAFFRHANRDHPAVAELMRLFCFNRLKKRSGGDNINVK